MSRSLQDTSHNEHPIASKFEELRSRREGALIAYLTGGDPTPEEFHANASALVEGGADIVEIGIPFSDPIADGPVIQASSQRALTAGITTKKVLSLAGEFSAQHDVPLVLLTYCNPILAMGAERFFQIAQKSGVSGMVVPDMPANADPQFHKLASKNDIDTILLAAPNTPETRLRRILAETTGFLYLVSLYGVTGPRKTLGPQALDTLKRVSSINKRRTPVDKGRRGRSNSRKRTSADHPGPFEQCWRNGRIVEEACRRAETCHPEILIQSNLKSSLTVVRTM